MLTIMLTPNETIQLLISNFPDLALKLQPVPRCGGFYRPLGQFALYTHQAILANQLTRLRQCFAVAEELLRRGNAYLAAAMETIYLPDLHLDDTPEGVALARQLMPTRLFQAYEHQRADILA
ncbi:hypothetical protein GCM10011383_38030 [Hymenobacter cavernae]|uniref:DUF7674 domain-containing protein n=3 Tax=Hymenobacteraceae TaxID=1853232 RepID=A0A243WA98_9BACT|nr:hypothetical protein BXP70_18755 [Hymenobacter crusticola]GGF22754.1 hypothetical protein GCM10011383_38030 [Hymenobacter cavernae]